MSPVDTLIAQRILVRDLPDRSRVVATLRVARIAGNAHPNFSATGEVYEPHGTWSGAACARNGREADCVGCVHEDILRAFPGAAKFIAMHVSDYPSGVPMHAAANAAHYYFGRHLAYELKSYGPDYTRRHGTGYERAARTLRCEVADLPNIDGSAEDADAQFAAFVDTLRPRWARKAADAFAWLESLPDLFALRGYDGRGQACPRAELPASLIGAEQGEQVDV